MLENLRPNKFWYAVAVLVGSTVGVGIYGMPFAFQKAGFGVGLLFLLGIVGLVLLSNLLYGEVVLRTHERHQFVGYVKRYLNPWAQKFNLFLFWVAVYGALVGTIIISGDFLTNILSPYFNFSPFAFSTIFLIAASVLVLKGLKTVSRFDFFMMLLLGFIVLLIALLGTRRVDLANYTLGIRDFWFLPFGVILFAMNSMPGIPLVREALIGSEDKLKKALIAGTIIPAILYFVFTVFVVGVSGDFTSPDAISGLMGFLGPKIVLIGSLFGFLTSSTIFLNLATSLKESLRQDFHFNHWWAWLLAILPPYLLFLSGIRNFIDIIGLVGGVAISLEAILLIFVYISAKRNGDRIPEYSIRLPRPVLYLMMLVFAAGAAYTLFIK
ncbi:MAG: aromatic amino acid transport family protein [Patescibacteria group bacterium]